MRPQRRQRTERGVEVEEEERQRGREWSFGEVEEK